MKKETIGHNHGHDNCHGNGGCCSHHHCHRHFGDEPRLSISTYKNELLSLLLLLCGVVFNKFGVFGDIASLFNLNLGLVSLIYYIIAVLPVGAGILVSTLKFWKNLDFFNEFTLMLLATVGAFVIGEYPEGVAILLFYSFGEKLEESASDKARGRIRALIDKMPKEVWVESDRGEAVPVNPADIRIGDVIVVKPGERVALDSVLCDFDADFDSSAITGESVPVAVATGGNVSSGFIPVDKEVRLRVSHLYKDSTMSRIMAMVEESASQKSNAETLLRRITRWYTPAVMAMAVLLFVVPWMVSLFVSGFSFEWFDWFKRALVLLVCSCPCALVVSIPLSYFAAIGNASRFGMLFKGSRYLDSLRRVDTLVLDKTGTLTNGKFHVTDIKTADGADAESILALAASMDSHSGHPLAVAIVGRAKELNLVLPEVSDVHTVPHGLSGVLDGRQAIVGSASLMAENGIDIPADSSDSTEVYVAFDGKYMGAVLLDDTVKEGIAETFAKLRGMGVKRIEILSGDRDAAVAKVAKAVGADSYQSSLKPEDKHRIVSGLKTDGNYVAFIGDGINDSPSLAVADVGIAIGTSGSDVAMESADAVIMGDNLNRLVDAFALSRKIKRVVTENVSLAIGVKLLVMILGAFGVASLWAAVFADTGITIVTVLWTLFCLGIRRRKK